MKGIQINPWHAVAIYDNDTEASLQGALYSPADALPPMQFDTVARSNVSAFSLVRVSDEAEYAQDAGDWVQFDHAGGQFHTYFGAALLTAVPDGTYRAKITLANGDIYWSHALCCSVLFSSLAGAFDLALESCSQDTEFSLNYLATGADYVEVWLDGLLVGQYGPEFSVVGPSIPEFTLYVYTIVLKRDYEASNGGRVTLQREYELEVSSFGACFSNTLTPGAVSGGYGEELAYLEWWEGTDRQAQGILYQDQAGSAYRQRVYGKFWRDAPVPVDEQVFLVNANGNLVRQSATVAETLVLECWPVPDYLFAVLANTGNHDNITVQNMDGDATTVDRFSFSSSAVGEDDRHKGIFSLTVNTVYVAGCQEDYVEGIPDEE